MNVYLQGQCAAPYAFAAVGALEGAQSLAQKSLVSLSVQNVIDCAGNRCGKVYHEHLHEQLEYYTFMVMNNIMYNL